MAHANIEPSRQHRLPEWRKRHDADPPCRDHAALRHDRRAIRRRQAQALKKISDGQVSKTAPNWPNFIAAEKGFFRREGIELETVYVGNVANTVQQLVAGSFDVASSTFDTAVRAIGNGGNAVMIGGMVTKYPYSIMTVADVTTAADMKGKRDHPAVPEGPARPSSGIAG